MPAATRRRQSWNTPLEQDFSLGIVRDTPRINIPPGGVYDSLDFLLHRPGVAFKRGGTSYAGPATGGGSKIIAVIYANFPSIGAKLLALADNFHLYTVAGSTTDVGTISGTFGGMVDNPTLYVGGTHNFVVFPDFGGGTVPWYYDGFAPPQQFQGGNVDATGDYTLTITGTPTGGSFALAASAQPDPVLGGPGTGLDAAATFVTGTIAYNASASTVATALNNATAAAGYPPTFTATGGNLPGTGVAITVPIGWSISVVPSAISGLSFTGGSSPYAKIGPVGGSTPANVPTGRFACTHLQRLLLANSYTYQNRIWFGPVINPTATAWDTANAWIDMDHTVSGMASLSDQLLVWSTRQMWRIVGDTPPPESNMLIEPIAEIGCSDARSIVTYGSQCIFANPESVYVTTGIAPVSLMEDRIESYWQSLFSSYTPAADAWTISAGLHRGRFLFVTVLNGVTQVATLMCDLPRRAWTRLSNMPHKMYSTAYGVSPELYAASSDEARVYSLAGIFNPSSSVKNDADGTAVTCTLETKPLRASVGEKAFGHAWVDLDMRDSASDNPTMAVTVASGVEATTYASVAESPLTETTDMERKRFSLNRDTEAVSVKFAQSNASSKTEIYALKREERSYYPEAEGQ